MTAEFLGESTWLKAVGRKGERVVWLLYVVSLLSLLLSGCNLV